MEHQLYEEEETESAYSHIPPARIHEEIKQLPEGCRVVLNLYLLEGYKHKEIAEIMNFSVSTSKSQYNRAKNLLKDRLMKRMAH